MTVFPTYPMRGAHKCPICGTQHDAQTILVPIDGTVDGADVEAIPVHLMCILSNIRYSKEHKLMGLEAEE